MTQVFFGAIIGRVIQSQDFGTEYWKFLGLVSGSPGFY